MALSGFAEAFSLAAIIPVLSTISDPTKILTIPFFSYIFNILNFSSNKEIIISTIIIFCFSNVVSSIIRTYSLWLNTKYSASIGHDISCELYQSMINLPYKEQLKINSAEEIASITTYINGTIIVIQNFLQVVTAIIVGSSLFIILLLIDFKISLICIFFFVSAYLIVSSINRNRLIKNSKKMTEYEETIIAKVQEGLGALREITLRSGQGILLKNFSKYDLKLRNTKSENIIIGSYPRYLIETIGIITLSSALVYLYLLNISIAKIISTIGAFGLGSQRILPALQQIYYGWTTIKSQSFSIKTVLKKIKSYKSKASKFEGNKEKFTLKNQIELKKVFYKYSDKDKYVLEDISFKINRGESVGIFGITGGGKSTLLDIIMGLLPPSKGKVLIDGIDIYATKNINILNSWRNSIGHVPQSIFLINSTIANNISFDFTATKIKKSELDKVAVKADLVNLINRLRDGFNSLVGENGINLSGGEKQRISIARALFLNPQVIFFDEATSALDQKTEEKIINQLEKEKGKTIIMISHRLSTLDGCNKKIKLVNGKVIIE